MNTIIVNLSDFDKKVLKHELVDIQEWVQLALDGKINKVKKRLLKEAQDKLFSDENIENIPATISGSISLYLDRPYYQDREQVLSSSMQQLPE